MNRVNPQPVNRPRITKILPYLVLMIVILLSFYSWSVSKDSLKYKAQERFNFRVLEITRQIIERSKDYEMLLRGGAGLFVATGNVSRTQWRDYVNTLDVGMRYPGIQGIGVAEFVNRSEIQKHVEEIRAEGFPEYAIRPDGDRKVYAPVIYLEPFDGADISEHSLMYESSGTREKSSGEKENPLAQKKVVDLYGHQWTLVFSKLNSPGGYFEAYQPIPILVLGCSIALLAFLYMRSLERTEEKAFVMAKDITTELRQNEIALKNSNRALRMISLCNEK